MLELTVLTYFELNKVNGLVANKATIWNNFEIKYNCMSMMVVDYNIYALTPSLDTRNV